MRQPARELPDRLHLLRLAQCFLRGHQLARALLHLGFERGGEIGQRLFRPPPLRRLPGALGDLPDEAELVLGPCPGLRMVEIQQRDQAFLLGHRHVDEGAGRDRLQRRRRGAGARVHPGIRHHGGLASFQVIDIRAELAEPQHPGQAVDAGCVPVPGDGDGLGGTVDQAVAGAADTQGAADQLGGGEADLVRIVLRTEDVAQFDQGGAHAVGRTFERNVTRHAGHPQRAAMRVRERLAAGGQPAHRAVRAQDPVGHVVIRLPLDHALGGGLRPAAILGQDSLQTVLVGERLVQRTPE